MQQTNGTADFQVDITGGSLISPDGTQAVFYTAGGPGVGRTATRKASSNFNFNFSGGGIVELEIDMYRNWWAMFFGAGFDADGDGHIAPGAAGEPDDGGIQLNIASYNATSNNYLKLPNGSTFIFDDDNSGWCRYKIVLDFTANSGEGAVALFFKPGAAGPWLAINEVQGINMHLTPGSGDKNDYSVWDGIFFHSQGATGAFDNIIIRQPPPGQFYQFINFPTITNKLTTEPPFNINATATSGLPVQYEILTGPASVAGNTITLNGQAGIVQVKARQPGNAQWAAAPEVINSFEVVDATAYYADLFIRRPADTTKVFMPELSPLMLVAEATVDHPEVLSIQQLTFSVQGNIADVKDWNTGYYTTWWTPPVYGTYTLTVEAAITGGNVTTHEVSFEVVQNSTDQTRQAFDQVGITGANNNALGTFVFPSFAGAFDTIWGLLAVSCPPGGCDPWDRIGSVEAKTASGAWIEIFRYITPYNVPCEHKVDLTDFASVLQGAVDFRFNIGTQGNGFVVDLSFIYEKGTPPYKYSWVQPVWELITFPFGDYLNLQPVAPVTWNFTEGTEKAKLKLITTGHGWGNNNTGNAMEFYNATHNIKINGNIEFTQNQWVVCSPNPDSCQPQNGTWYYNRAGWCPGSIPPFYEFDLTPFIGLPDVNIFYEFDPDYVDLCHPHHPNCVSGVTCPDCLDTDNPKNLVTGNMIVYGQNLGIGINDITLNPFHLRLIPNPARGSVRLLALNYIGLSGAEVHVLTATGQLKQQFTWDGQELIIDLAGIAKGIYIVQVKTVKGLEVKKLVVY